MGSESMEHVFNPEGDTPLGPLQKELNKFRKDVEVRELTEAEQARFKELRDMEESIIAGRQREAEKIVESRKKL